MRTTLKQTNTGAVEIWQGHNLMGTIYATPAGITLQADNLEPTDLDLDTSGPPALHVTLRATERTVRKFRNLPAL